MSETPQNRSRRKFTAGALEQVAATFGALAVAVVVTSIIAPLVAAATGLSRDYALVRIATVGGLSAMALFCAAAYLRGLAKQLDDDKTEAGTEP